MSRATDAALCREAALQVERGEEAWSCVALHKIQRIGSWSNWDPASLKYRYREFMLGGEGRAVLLFPRDEFGEMGYESKKSRDVRVLALCFMACAIETGDA